MGENKGTLLIPGGDLVQGKRPHDAVAGQGEDRPDLPLSSQSCKILVDPKLSDDSLKREKVPVSIGCCRYGCDAVGPGIPSVHTFTGFMCLISKRIL